jgi:hypothetical protein
MTDERLPSFSIAIESANLEHGGLAGLRDCLESLALQDVSPGRANEVLLVDAGGVPPREAAALRAEFPWLTVERAGPEAGYVSMKLRAGNRATSEIMVLCDSDCRYESGWLRSMLEPFANPEVHIVAGETSTPIRGSRELAIALTFIFPRFTGERSLAVSPIYWANNVAMRRDLLQRLPIPDTALLYRGQNILHSMGVAALGHAIWRQPLARAWHLPPSFGELAHRFSRLGRDSVQVVRLARQTPGPYRGEMAPDRFGGTRLQKLARRFRTVVAEDPRYLRHLPAAIPIAALLAGCYYAGRIASRLSASPAPRAETAAGP